MSLGTIRFIETTVPDGSQGGVMALKDLSNRSLILPVEIPQKNNYSFSVWLKSDTTGSITINIFGEEALCETTTNWQRFTIISSARENNYMTITPEDNSEYLIYQAMLETGNKPSDWCPSPEDDVESFNEVKQALLNLTPDAIIGTVMNSQSMTELRQEADRIALVVDDFVDNGAPKVHNAAVIIDLNGIFMQGSNIEMQSGNILMDGSNITIQSGSEFLVDSDGSVKINATNTQDSFIKLGDIFSVSYSGGLVAGEAEFSKLKIGGKDPWTDGNLIVSSTMPSTRPCIWLQPNGTTTLNYSGASSSSTLYFENGNPSLTLIKNSSGTFSASTEYIYKITFKISNTSGNYLGNVSFTATLSDGSRSVSGTSQVVEIGAYDLRVITIQIKSTSINLCSGSGNITATYSASRALTGLRLHPAYTNILDCTAASTQGAIACNIFWCP